MESFLGEMTLDGLLAWASDHSEAVIVLGGLAFMTLMSLSHGREADLMDDLDERGKVNNGNIGVDVREL